MTPATADREAAIVYGAYINGHADWRKLIRAQLSDLRRYGVLSASDLYVIVTNPSQEAGVREFFDSLPVSIKHIEFNSENKFEYPAIAYIWSLANRAMTYKYVGYLHTKGMSYASRHRDKIEKTLTHFTFSRWRMVLRFFEDQDDVNKIGIFPAKDGEKRGWIWFNFWWARASYIRTLPKPEETSNRHYYESWLSLSFQSGDKPDCHSIYTNDRSEFTSYDVGGHIQNLKWRMRYGPLQSIREKLDTLRNFRRRYFA